MEESPSSSSPTESETDMQQLQRTLDQVRAELSQAHDTIARLEAENAELRRQKAERFSENGGANKNGQIGAASGGEVEADGAEKVDGPSGDGNGNEEKKDEETADNTDAVAGINEAGENNATAANTTAETPNRTDKNDTDTDKNNIDKANDDNESDNDDADSGGSDSDDNSDQENQDEPPADDIRLRAARTLIWAESAMKRAEALKEQQKEQQSVRDSLMSGGDNETPRSSSVAGSHKNHNQPPSTVRIAQSTDADTLDDDNGDDASFLSDDGSYSTATDRSTPTNRQPGRRIRGSLMRIGQFLEDKMDDVAERLVGLDLPQGQQAADNRSLHSASVAAGSTGSGLPPRSPTDYKYCNAAMKNKMTSGDDNGDGSSTRTPASAASSGSGDKPKPMMNEAMMARLSSEKKKARGAGGGLGGRLFSG